VNVEPLAAEKTPPECLQLTTGLFSVAETQIKIRKLEKKQVVRIEDEIY
jgi:hypothetical protein